MGGVCNEGLSKRSIGVFHQTTGELPLNCMSEEDSHHECAGHSAKKGNALSAEETPQ